MAKGRFDIIDSETRYEGWAKLSNYRVSYSQKDSEDVILGREVFDSGDGAAVLLYNIEKQSILLIRQYRIVAELGGDGDGWLLECCAGLLDENDPETTIKKEIEEETGYRIEKVEKLFAAYASPGAHMEKIHFYLAEYQLEMQVSAGGGRGDEYEDIEVVEFLFSDIHRLILDGSVIDQKTIVLLLWAKSRFGLQ